MLHHSMSEMIMKRIIMWYVLTTGNLLDKIEDSNNRDTLKEDTRSRVDTLSKVKEDTGNLSNTILQLHRYVDSIHSTLYFPLVPLVHEKLITGK